jgi:hypothetical protein
MSACRRISLSSGVKMCGASSTGADARMAAARSRISERDISSDIDTSRVFDGSRPASLIDMARIFCMASESETRNPFSIRSAYLPSK